MNVLSLFDGMSCGQIALERAGVKVDNYYASEIDKYAIKVTQANYPNTVQLGDITKVYYKNKDLIWNRRNFKETKIDLILAGSPCQGFSFAGKQLNFDDPRSKLFFDFVRLLKECKPKYFLLENVRMKKEYQEVISKELGVEPILINSALLSAQNRKRLYWTNIPNVTQPEDKGLLLKDIVEDGVVNKDKAQTVLSTIYKENAKSMIKRKKFGLLVSKANVVRKFTPTECERLQTIPDNYTNHVSNSQRYKMLGNGWTVDIIVHILKNIV